MLRQVKILKKYEWGYMFLETAHARYTRCCFVWYRLDMIFVLHAPLVFEQKSALDPSFLNRNSCENMLAIAKNVAHGPFVFGREKRHEPLVFEQKLCSKHVFSVQKLMAQRHFMSKIEVCGAMGLSRISRPRDLANPLRVEPLSL